MSEPTKYYLLGMAADKLKEHGMEIPVTTLRGWFNELHKLKVHSLPRNERKERVLSEVELKIAEFIHEAKKAYGNQITLKTIAEQMAGRFDTRYIGEDEETSFHLDILDDDRLKNAVQMLVQAELARAKGEMLEEAAVLLRERAAALLPDPDVEKERKIQDKKEQLVMVRTEQLNIWSVEKRLRQKLRDEAVAEWNKAPAMTGFLKKREDISKRNIFIDEYIERNLTEDRLKELYDENYPVDEKDIM